MEIVENRRGRLSRPFLSPRDNFSKSYGKKQIWSERTGGTHAPRGRVQIPESARAGGSKPLGGLRGLRAAAPNRSGFRHKWSRKTPPAILYNLH